MIARRDDDIPAFTADTLDHGREQADVRRVRQINPDADGLPLTSLPWRQSLHVQFRNTGAKLSTPFAALQIEVGPTRGDLLSGVGW